MCGFIRGSPGEGATSKLLLVVGRTPFLVVLGPHVLLLADGRGGSQFLAATHKPYSSTLSPLI